MTKKQIIVVALIAVIVVALYAYLYKDAFQKPSIQIGHTSSRAAVLRNRNPNAASRPQPTTMSFVLRPEVRLTSVKVVSLDELKTNKFAHPIWELVTDSNSVPTQTFTYGGKIQGMRSSMPGVRTDPLQTNVPYRILVEAGKLKGQHDFTISNENHLAQ